MIKLVTIMFNIHLKKHLIRTQHAKPSPSGNVFGKLHYGQNIVILVFFSLQIMVISKDFLPK